jgi:hypothetical protein
MATCRAIKPGSLENILMSVQTVYTPIGKLCYPALFVPKAPMNGGVGDPRYSLILVFDKEGLNSVAYKELRAQVQEAAAEKWGAKAQDGAFMRSLRLPFRDSSEKGHLEGFDYGPVYISPWTKRKPGIVDLNGSEILVPDDVFAGQLGRATVRPFAYEQQGNKGVAFGLEHVQIVKADEPRIDGRRSAASAFAGAGDDELKRMGITAPANDNRPKPANDNAPSSQAATGTDSDLPW